MKYNVGDKVKIRKDLNCDIECRALVIEPMLPFAGKEAVIKMVLNDCGAYSIDIDDWNFLWNDEMFEGLANDFKIEGFKNKNATICLMKKDGKVIAKGVAKCCPDDDYDFEFGIRLAFFRMMELSTDELLHEPVKKPSFKFKENDLVKVINPYDQFLIRKEIANTICPERAEHFNHLEMFCDADQEFGIFRVDGCFVHPRYKTMNMVLIQNIQTGKMYYFDEAGLQLLTPGKDEVA